jgi:hypothetical protein
MKAFVSSTFQDLKEHRQYVIGKLRRAGIVVDPMEDWTATSDEPKKFSVERFRGCDICVLLVARRRGFIPDGESKSITQLEYDYAREKGLTILTYLLDDDAFWQRKFDELDFDPLLRQWRTELASNHGVEFFNHQPQSIDVVPAITRLLAGSEYRKRSKDLLDKIFEKGMISVGYFHYPPLIIAMGANKAPGGLYGTLMNEVAITNKLDICWQQIKLSQLQRAICCSEVDIVLCVFQTPSRCKYADFHAFLHAVTVGGIGLKSFGDVNMSPSTLSRSSAKIVVCEGEIGHEFAINSLKIDSSRLRVVDLIDIDQIVSMVESGFADIALLNSISCRTYIENRQDAGDLRLFYQNTPLAICENGVMTPANQNSLGDWIRDQFHMHRRKAEILAIEEEILSRYEGAIVQF